MIHVVCTACIFIIVISYAIIDLKNSIINILNLTTCVEKKLKTLYEYIFHIEQNTVFVNCFSYII